MKYFLVEWTQPGGGIYISDGDYSHHEDLDGSDLIPAESPTQAERIVRRARGVARVYVTPIEED